MMRFLLMQQKMLLVTNGKISLSSQINDLNIKNCYITNHTEQPISTLPPCLHYPVTLKDKTQERISLCGQSPLPYLPQHCTHLLALGEKTHLLPLLATTDFTVWMVLNWLLWAVIGSAVWACILLLWPFWTGLNWHQPVGELEGVLTYLGDL